MDFTCLFRPLVTTTLIFLTDCLVITESHGILFDIFACLTIVMHCAIHH